MCFLKNLKFDIQLGMDLLKTASKAQAVKEKINTFDSVQFSSVAQSCPTLCDLMNRSTPGFPVHHRLPEFIHSRPSSR